MTQRENRATVVGAGVAGLTCAIDLARRGWNVEVWEKDGDAGGKASRARLGELSIDAGPTVFTMPWVFDELFDDAGGDFRQALTLRPIETIARHYWSAQRHMDLFADLQRSADAIGRAFGAKEARAYLAFSAETRKIYELSEPHFLRSQRLSLPALIKEFGRAGLGAIATLGSHRTMAQALRRHFASPELRQLFGRYATYCGSSPYEAPATLNLISHVETQGVYRAEGGMRALIRALVGLAQTLGVEFRYDCPVDSIRVQNGRAVGVERSAEFRASDAIVFTGDVSALGTGLLGRAAQGVASPTKPAARSLSAVTWAMVARSEGVPLSHHNVFFQPDYRSEFTSVFERGRVPDRPTVYICAQDRSDRVGALESERLLVLVNAPPNGDEPSRWNDHERERCTNVMRDVLKRTGLHLSTEMSVMSTPAEFHRRFPGTGGALYGPRWRGGLSVFGRAGSHTKVAGLYLAGGSVHPGPGVPMAGLSGRLAAAKICEDHVSTAPSRTVVTSGPTLTP